MTKPELRALAVGVVALIAIIIGAFFTARVFFVAYLFAWIFWLGVALGSLGLLMVHALTGGRWGNAIRIPMTAAVATIPLLAILFIPILAGISTLYPWTSPAVHAQHAWLNVPWFIVRSIVYFACWIWLAIEYVRRPARAAAWAGGGLVLYAVTMTFASWDWMMSLDPAWWSSIYAMIVITGQGLSAMAVMIIVAVRQPREEGTMLDLGNLLLTFVIFWTYVEFSQLLLMWSGDMKSEIAWYLPRMRPPWVWVALALAVLYFFAPFFALLFREAKRNPTLITSIAILILAMRFFDLLWTIAPSVHPLYIVSWMDIVAPVAIGGLWIAAFRWLLRRFRAEAVRA